MVLSLSSFWGRFVWTWQKESLCESHAEKGWYSCYCWDWVCLRNRLNKNIPLTSLLLLHSLSEEVSFSTESHFWKTKEKLGCSFINFHLTWTGINRKTETGRVSSEDLFKILLCCPLSQDSLSPSSFSDEGISSLSSKTTIILVVDCSPMKGSELRQKKSRMKEET